MYFNWRPFIALLITFVVAIIFYWIALEIVHDIDPNNRLGPISQVTLRI